MIQPIVEESNSCVTIFIPKGACTIVLQDVQSELVIVKENNGTTIEILDDALKCHKG